MPNLKARVVIEYPEGLWLGWVGAEAGWGGGGGGGRVSRMLRIVFKKNCPCCIMDVGSSGSMESSDPCFVLSMQLYLPQK